MRYIRLYKICVKNCLIRDMEYNVGFFSSLFSALLWVALQIIFIQIIFGNIKSLGGWSFQEMLLLTGFYVTINAILFALFVRNFNKFNDYIHKGHLDLVLTKPVNSQFFCSLRYFNLTHVFHIFVGIFIVFYALLKIGVNVNILEFGIFFIVLIASILICYSLWFILMCSIFLMERDQDLREIFISVFRFGRFPDVYTYYLKIVFMVLMPAIFAAYLPAAVLLGKVSSSFLIYFVLVSIFFFFLSTKIWKICLKKYTSVGN